MGQMICPDQKDWVEKCPMIEFTINSSIGRTTGLALFKINYGYMPIMMKVVKDMEKTPTGVRTFAKNTLKKHGTNTDALIEFRVF